MSSIGTRLPRKVVESPYLDVIKRLYVWSSGLQFSDRLGSDRLTVVLDELKGLFKPK